MVRQRGEMVFLIEGPVSGSQRPTQVLDEQFIPMSEVTRGLDLPMSNSQVLQEVQQPPLLKMLIVRVFHFEGKHCTQHAEFWRTLDAAGRNEALRRFCRGLQAA